MKIETIDNQRILVPDNGMWLYNEQAQVISDKVYLGIEADESDWIEISAEEKTRLEALWSEGVLSEAELKAQAYDIIVGGAE